MNSFLPAGIESYLKESGFTATEMLVLRKLVEVDSLTIRELGSKTGKSTGVLDQAMKKLLSKSIAEKKTINGQPRYSIHSLESIVKWVQKDMEEKKKILDRRHQNFESFIASLKVDKKRPDIEYYHGHDGVQQAYRKLLDTNQELLTQTPILHLAEDDPFRVFRVEMFRRRQVRKIFQRVLAPDTMLARRYRSRDPFEYRRTLLLPEDQLPIPFEKTIAGDIIACINIPDKSACLLKYPELAKAERDAFNALWSRAQALERGEGTQATTTLAPASVPFKTRLYSSFREFILSRRSIAAFILFALIAGGLTFGLYKNNRELNLQRMRDKVMAIAATGALQIRSGELDALRTEEDYLKSEWAKVVNQLREIRKTNEEILFVYLIRKTNSKNMEFIADSHSIDPYANLDRNSQNDVDVNDDGIIDSVDFLQTPGQPYPTPPEEAFSAFEQVTANAEFYEDAWGKVITGYAPVRDTNNKAVAVLAIDMQAETLDAMTAETFVPIYVFLFIFGSFLIVRLVAYGSFVHRGKHPTGMVHN